MRIRKRFPQQPPPPPAPPSSSLPSSSSSMAGTAAALLVSSDPQLNRPPVMHLHDMNHLFVVQTNSYPTSSDPSPPPNQELLMMIGSTANPRWGFLNSVLEEKRIHEEEEGGQKQEQELEEEKKKKKTSSKDARKERFTPQILNTDLHLSPSATSSSTVVVLPLKKRKESFDGIIMASRKEINEKDQKMKSKTNKKCLSPNDDDDDGNDDEKEMMKQNVNIGKKMKMKVRRGSVIKEGSRCSRVNGRGWRCCQPTLVGYSLCEHHLGKGRLRSMTSVRNRAAGMQIAPPQPQQPFSTLMQEKNQEFGSDHEEVEEEEEGLMVNKRKVKLGVVKARSISSLLGRTNISNTAAMAAATDIIAGDS